MSGATLPRSVLESAGIGQPAGRHSSALRVLYIEASMGGVMGGSLTGLQHLLRGIDRRRYDPVVVLYEEKPLQSELARLGIPVRIFRKLKRGRYHPLQQVAAYQRLRRQPMAAEAMLSLRALRLFVQETLPATAGLVRLFRQEQPDLIHLCNGFRGNLDAVVAAWLTRIPCICHAKGLDRYSWPDRLFAHTVDLGICMTAAVHRHCDEQRIRAKRMMTIYDGLDVEGFRPTRNSLVTRKEFGIPPDVPVVGIVGHIQAWKGQAVVVEAIAAVRAVLPQIRCLIVGGVHRLGTEYGRLVSGLVEARGLQQNVIFTGSREDVPDLMAAMDILIHASIAPEPFGRVILEGMSLGKPVIATRVGGVPEIVRDGVTGRLVPPNDHKALAEAILDLLKDAAYRERLGINGRQEVQRRFVIERHVKEVTDAYATIMSNGSLALS